MSRFDNKRLFTRQEFEVLFYQPVLHPVLTYLPGLAISDEFIRIESDIKTKIIVDHHLKGLAFNTVPLIFVDGFGFEVACRTKTVPIDSSPGPQLLQKFRSQFSVQFYRDITQCIF